MNQLKLYQQLYYKEVVDRKKLKTEVRLLFSSLPQNPSKLEKDDLIKEIDRIRRKLGDLLL
jgi:hypothetical protein